MDFSNELWDLRDLVWSRVSGSLASDGVYMKAEMVIEGVNHYLKLSNYDSFRGIYGHEAVNELLACRLGKLLGFNVPEGFLRKCLVNIDGKNHETYVFAAKTYKTVKSRDAFETFYFNFRLSEIESPLDFCLRYGWGDDIFKMFVFDYLIINRDRHGANLEVLKNGTPELSPLFDNGLSFVCSCTEEADLAAFSIMEDRPVNNFIGEKRLEKNLNLIDKLVSFNELCEIDRDYIFADLNNVLSERYIAVIWEIIWRRWENVTKFRLT